MDDIDRRIRRITEDLRLLQEEFDWAAIAGPDNLEQKKLLDQLLSPDVLADFKGAVDHMRHFLWWYIDAAAKDARQAGVDYTLNAYRLQRVTEMLRSLRTSVPHQASADDTSTFVDWVNGIVKDRCEENAVDPAAKAKDNVA